LLEGGKFLSPKTFRKGGGEQLRRGFVQPGNENNPSLRCGSDTFLDFVRPLQPSESNPFSNNLSVPLYSAGR